MKQSKSAEQHPKLTKRAWSAPVLEQIEMHSTKGGNTNGMIEMTLEQSRAAFTS